MVTAVQAYWLNRKRRQKRRAGDAYPDSVTLNPSFVYELEDWTAAYTGTVQDVGWAPDYAILHRIDASNYNAVRQTHTLVDGDWYQVTASVLGAYSVLVRVGDTLGGQQTATEFAVAGGATETVVFQATAATTYLQARSQANGQDTFIDLLMIEPFTGDLPVIELSALTVAEDASIGTLIGTLSTANAPATWGTSTYTITADPDGVFALDGADDTLFEVGAALDYETATSHLVTITDTPSGPFDPISRQFTISVTNVLEVTLNALSIDDNTAVEDAAWSATITGKTSGSTITATSSDGTILTVVGTTVSGTFAAAGSPTITLQETHPDAAPVETEIGLTVEAAPTGVPQIIVIVYGQSNAGNLVLTSSGSVPTPAAETYAWDPATSTWLAPDDLAVPVRDGGINILNRLREENPTKTIGLIFSYKNATSAVDLAEGAPGEADAGAWLTLKGRINDSGAASAEDHYIVWRQGEHEGNSAGINTAAYHAALSAIHQSIADELGVAKAAVPFIVSSLAPLNDPTDTWIATSATWSAVNAALKDVEGTNTNQWFSHSNYDATLGDAVHEDGASCGRSGLRYAETILWLRGQTADRPHWSIASVERTSATTTRVNLTHSMGTDFTPTSGIAGFEISDDGATWIAAVGARIDADTIELTHTTLGATTADDRYVRYQYMADRADEDVLPVVVDNSALTVPLTMSAGDVLVKYALPVMTSSTTFSTPENQTYVADLTCSRPSTFAIGGTDGALFEIQSGDELHFVDAPDYEAPGDSGGNNVYDVTITPTAIDNSDVGSAQSVAVTVTDEADTAGKTKTFAGSIADNSGSHAVSGSIDIGAASTDRYVLLAVYCQGAQPADPTVVVNGVTLTKLVDDTSGSYVTFWGGLVTSGNGSQTVSVTFADGDFFYKMAAVWVLKGLSSTTPVAGTNTGNAAGFTAITVAADDFLFVARIRGGSTDEGMSNSPTQAPDRSSNIASGAGRGFNADTLVTSSTASFNLGLDNTTSSTSYVRFA